MTEPTPHLYFQNVSAERGLRPLFSDCSGGLHAGEVVLLRGPNGTGKTTLLRILAGLTEPTAGEIVRVQPLVYWGHAPALKDEFTARENLQLLCTQEAMPMSRIDHALHRVGLGQRVQVITRKLSAGQRRRVGLAWLSLSPIGAWLLDEPTTALDAQGVVLFSEILNTHLSQGGSALVATHLDIPGLTAAPRVLNMESHAR